MKFLTSLTAVLIPLVATAHVSRGTFCSNPEPDPSLQLPCLPISSKQRLLLCHLQAQPSSQTPVMSAKDTCADKIRFITLSQSDLLKEKARGMLFQQGYNRKAKAGLPKLQSCFILCAGCKRLFQEVLTKGECSPYPQAESPEPCFAVLLCSSWSTRTYGKDCIFSWFSAVQTWEGKIV